MQAIAHALLRLGTRKLYHTVPSCYACRAWAVGALLPLLRQHGLLVAPKRSYTKKNISYHRLRCHPNPVCDAAKITVPN